MKKIEKLIMLFVIINAGLLSYGILTNNEQKVKVNVEGKTSIKNMDELRKISSNEDYESINKVDKKTLVKKLQEVGIEEEVADYDLRNVNVVFFDSNGGNGIKYELVETGDKVNKPKNPVRSCYTFNNWLTDKGEVYDFTKEVKGNITLIANWSLNDNCKNKEEHIVIFDTQGGNDIDSVYVINGNKVSKPNDPVKTGYEFIGWYYNDELYDFNNKVTKDIVLFAKYKEIKKENNYVKVTFDTLGGSLLESVKLIKGSILDIPKIPVKKGYIFDGWYLKDKLYNFKEKVNENITLVAKWVKEETNKDEYLMFCKNKNKTYYSTSYIVKGSNVNNYSWTINFDKLNANKASITDVGYLSSLSSYESSYIYFYNKDISMKNGNNKYSVLPESGYSLMNHSLKSDNFTMNVSRLYNEDNTWYSNITVDIKNLDNVNSYYAENINSEIYFVPFYIVVSYTDLDDCKIDIKSNKKLYNDYEIIEIN